MAVLFSLWGLYSNLLGIYNNYFGKGNFFLPFNQSAETMLVGARGMPEAGRKTAVVEARRMTNRMNSQFAQRRTKLIPGGSFVDVHSERNLIDYVPPPIEPIPSAIYQSTKKRTEIVSGRVIDLQDELIQESEFNMIHDGQRGAHTRAHTYLKVFTETP